MAKASTDPRDTSLSVIWVVPAAAALIALSLAFIPPSPAPTTMQVYDAEGVYMLTIEDFPNTGACESHFTDAIAVLVPDATYTCT